MSNGNDDLDKANEERRAKLVKAGVLESPLHSRLFPQDHPGEVYPVRGVAEANLEMLEPSSASEADSR